MANTGISLFCFDRFAAGVRAAWPVTVTTGENGCGRDLAQPAAPPRSLKGPEEIAGFLGFLHAWVYPGFSFENVKIRLETPEQVSAEYHINHKSGISGKEVQQQFFGHLEAEGGNIRRLREGIDVI